MIQLEPKRTAFDLNWKMLRVPVRVHPLFWIAALFLAYSASIRFEFVLINVACILLSILVHEFGHALSHRYYGDSHPRIVLYMMGGLCMGGAHSPSRRERILILLWGPGAGFILAAISYAVFKSMARDYIPENIYVFAALGQLVFINVAWSLMNLIPAFPLDGGQIVREWVLWKKPHLGERFAFTVSMYAAIFGAAASLAWHLYQRNEDSRGLIPVIFFAGLAFNSYHIRRQIGLYGEMSEQEGSRQAWERDADWWKKG